MNTIKEKLIALRSSRDMSQEDLGRELGVSVVTVNRWENGHNLPRKSMRRTIDRLLKRSQKMKALEIKAMMEMIGANQMAELARKGELTPDAVMDMEAKDIDNISSCTESFRVQYLCKSAKRQLEIFMKTREMLQDEMAKELEREISGNPV